MAPRRESGSIVPGAAESLILDNFPDETQTFGMQDDNDDGQDDGNDDVGAGLDDQDDFEEGSLDSNDDDFGDDEDDNIFASGDQDDDNVVPMRRREGDQRGKGRQLDDMRGPKRGANTGDKKAIIRDKAGNIVDKNGKVLARAGAQARFYETAQKERAKAADATSRVQIAESRVQQAVRIARDFQGQVKTFEAQQKAIKDFGFTPEDQVSALQLFSDIRKNPEQTVRRLLTTLASRGINIGGQNGSGMDMKSISDVINEQIGKAMTPLNERAAREKAADEQRQREEGLMRETRTEVEGFFSRNPEARRHIPVFNRVKADPQYADLSLGEIWARIKDNLRNRNGSNRDNPRNRRINSRAGSPPQGRGAPPNGGGGRGYGDQMAPVTDSYDSIIGDVLDRAGMRRTA